MKTAALLIPVTAAAMIATVPAGADFSGPYAPANWTFNANGGSGTAVNNGTTLTIVGDNGGAAGGQATDYTIAAAASGTLSFDWLYTTIDTGTWDSGGYLVNGVYTVLAFNNTAGGGSVSIPVNAGDIIGFRVNSGDGGIGAATLNITNFVGPVPGPAALALLGMAGAIGSRRRRRA